jgi:hypothetical protein
MQCKQKNGPSLNGAKVVYEEKTSNKVYMGGRDIIRESRVDGKSRKCVR